MFGFTRCEIHARPRVERSVTAAGEVEVVGDGQSIARALLCIPKLAILTARSFTDSFFFHGPIVSSLRSSTVAKAMVDRSELRPARTVRTPHQSSLRSDDAGRELLRILIFIAASLSSVAPSSNG